MKKAITLAASVAKQADTESGAETPVETNGEATTSRKRVSKRDFVNASGGEAERIEEAAGGRYSLMNGAATAKAFDYIYGRNPDADRMLAIFGFFTKVGNVANTVLNDKNDPGDVNDAADAIDEFMSDLEKKVWAERAAGAGAARMDLDALAEAVTLAYEEAGDPDVKADRDAFKAKARELVEDIGNRRRFSGIGPIKTHYARLTGREAASLDALKKLMG